MAVLRWPSSEAVGVFGSYGRGDAGVGSDLDLLLILRRWDTSPLPLATDLLVYSRAEWESLSQWNPKLADVLARDVRWLVGP
ncbi:MAG: nucleotidyltransferase domain-containing protein [Prochlorococcaceae cyanobacterium]